MSQHKSGTIGHMKNEVGKWPRGGPSVIRDTSPPSNLTPETLCSDQWCKYLQLLLDVKLLGKAPIRSILLDEGIQHLGWPFVAGYEVLLGSQQVGTWWNWMGPTSYPLSVHRCWG